MRVEFYIRLKKKKKTKCRLDGDVIPLDRVTSTGWTRVGNVLKC